ncbi:MAG: hypothetical protein RIC52_13360 [Amphiplicatus sp.]
MCGASLTKAAFAYTVLQIAEENLIYPALAEFVRGDTPMPQWWEIMLSSEVERRRYLARRSLSIRFAGRE